MFQLSILGLQFTLHSNSWFFLSKSGGFHLNKPFHLIRSKTLKPSLSFLLSFNLYHKILPTPPLKCLQNPVTSTLIQRHHFFLCGLQHPPWTCPWSALALHTSWRRRTTSVYLISFYSASRFHLGCSWYKFERQSYKAKGRGPGGVS